MLFGGFFPLTYKDPHYFHGRRPEQEFSREANHLARASELRPMMIFFLHDRTSFLSIHDEDLRTLVSIGYVRVGFIVTGLKTGSRCQHESSAIFEPDS